MIGSNVNVGGQSRRINSVVETFLDPRGAVANSEFMRQVFDQFPNANISFELFTTSGQRITLTHANRDVLNIGLASRLGLPTE